MTAFEFEQKIASGEAQVLTLAAAKQLEGKRIRWFYLGDPSNVNSVRQMEVGPLISEWEYASRQPFEGYSSKADYWESYMSARRIEELKQTLLLLDAQGNAPYLRVHLYTDDNHISTPPLFSRKALKLHRGSTKEARLRIIAQFKSKGGACAFQKVVQKYYTYTQM